MALYQKIDSPFAKYTAGGQLTCIVCRCLVKGAKVWTAHINGRQHRENIVALKKMKSLSSASPVPVLKRKTEANDEIYLPKKRQKGSKILDDGSTHTHVVSDDKTMGGKSSAVMKDTIIRTALSNAEKRVSSPAQNNKSPSVVAVSGMSENTLPLDFFDESVPPMSFPEQSTSKALDSPLSGIGKDPTPWALKTKTKMEDTESANNPASLERLSMENLNKKKYAEDSNDATLRANTAEALPEGFFDDPNVDAKVRKVEPRDTMEEEWQRFQKEMQHAEMSSEVIMEVEDEEANLLKTIEEVDHQIEEWSRVNQLQQRKEDAFESQKDSNTVQYEVASKSTSATVAIAAHALQADDTASVTSSEISDELDVDEESMDWRAKNL